MDAQALSSLKLAPVITKKAEVFAKHLREKIAKEPEISVQILRSWIRRGRELMPDRGAPAMILNTTKAEGETLPNLRKAAMLLVALGEGSSARAAAAAQ